MFCQEDLIEAIEVAQGAKKDCLSFIEEMTHKDIQAKSCSSLVQDSQLLMLVLQRFFKWVGFATFSYWTILLVSTIIANYL